VTKFMSEFEDIFGEIEDGGRSHSRYAPSSLKRILACPRSVALSEGLTGSSTGRASVYAAEGTVAHEVGEAFLRQAVGQNYTLDAPGVKKTVDGHAVTVDQDMHVYGRAYADYVRKLMVPGDKLYVEMTVKLDGIVGEAANMYGHCDAIIWSPSRRLLIVIDFKYGRGIKVVAIDNEQLKAYALGALLSVPDIDPDDVLWVEMHVFQPRVPGQTPPDRMAAVDLLMWGHDELAPVIASIEKDGAAGSPLVTGDHCRFCPALAHCPAQRKRANEAVKRAFGAIEDAPSLSDDELATALKEARVVRAWLDGVEAEAMKRALAGKTIPDHKLVDTRARRVWKDEITAAIWAKANVEPGVEVYDRKLKSPAQIEKLLPGHADEMQPLVTAKSSGRTLVPLSDPRPPVRVSGAKDFFDAVDNSEDDD
jgi:hypothetical protein